MGRRLPRGVRQHAGHRRAGARRVHRGPRPAAAWRRCPRARPRAAGWSRRSSGACTGGSRTASPDNYRKQAEYEVVGHHADGLPGLLPGDGRPDRARALGQPARRPRPRLRGGQPRRLRPGHHRPRPDPPQADLRAVPQPRARLDARHRHGLRRAPARRDDPLRHREVRRGPDRADHHLLHDQGEGRDQGLRARALRAAGLRRRRPHHQVDAARGHGQGHPALRACSTPATSATPRPPRSGPSTSRTRRSRRSSTPPRTSRASSGSGACTPPA